MSTAPIEMKPAKPLPSADDLDRVADEMAAKLATSGPRPTPAQIDILVAEYEQAEACYAAAKQTLDAHKAKLIGLVTLHGELPAGAEKSMRLQGQLTECTVTTGTTIALKESAIRKLKDALYVNGQGALFFSLFQERHKYELVKGAETALRVAQIPKRLADRTMQMFAACFDVKTKSPSLKVTRLADRPVKSSRTRAAKRGA